MVEKEVKKNRVKLIAKGSSVEFVTEEEGKRFIKSFENNR